jgi:hypothetical protein
MGQDVEWIPFKLVWKAFRKRRGCHVCFGNEEDKSSERVPLVLLKKFKTSSFVANYHGIQYGDDKNRFLIGARKKLELTNKQLVHIFSFVGNGCCELLHLLNVSKSFQAALYLAILQVVYVDPQSPGAKSDETTLTLSRSVALSVRHYQNVQKISVCGAQVQHDSIFRSFSRESNP